MKDKQKLDEHVREARALLRSCSLCPRRCKANRTEDEKGFCGIGGKAVVASAGPHYGEERCLVGSGGSGTIFLAGCNLGCAFCQNEDISRKAAGQSMDAAALAETMLGLEARGCANINLVTPTHVTPMLMEAVLEARQRGMRVPVVWNSSGYERVEVLRLLEGIIDIYMPDFKFSLSASAARYCGAPDYPARACASVLEMQRQAGDLAIDGGVATRGLLVRHLVMPGGARESKEILDFLVTVSPRLFVNLMGQYRPAGKVLSPRHHEEFKQIACCTAPEEVAEVRDYAASLGLRLAD